MASHKNLTFRPAKNWLHMPSSTSISSRHHVLVIQQPPRQKFLLQTRDLIARRFREDHGSLAPNGTDANTYPYFVGVFDTVAALLNPQMAFLLVCMFLAFDAIASWILPLIHGLPLLGKFFPFLGSFW